jgi:acetyltransferase-like isoleucine patch superfamily enzyme
LPVDWEQRLNPFDLADRLVAGLASRWRNLYFRLRGVRLRGYVLLRAIEIPRNHAEIEIEAGASLDRGVVLLCSGPPRHEPKIRIGASTYINRNTMLDASEQLEIGRECAIGPDCYLTDHDHGFAPNTSPLALPLISSPTRLEDRVWLGARVVVLKGVTIGTGAVIGAGSVVTRSIPANCVAAGVPARIIRSLDAAPELAMSPGGH